MIKHRELAKLRCNLAGDVLLRGLARRGPRAAHTYTTHTRTHTHTNVCMFRATRHRKVLRDIAPAIRPSFWELNFCGCRHPLSFASLESFVRPKGWTDSRQGSNPFDARSPRFFSRCFLSRSPAFPRLLYHQLITSTHDL